MDHLQRFHRRRKDVAPPTLITNDLSGGKTTPPPGDLHPPSPMRPFQKLSPFRVFHRSSGKRARDSPPASLPHSPAAVPVLASDCADGRPVSPLSLKTDPASDEAVKVAKSAKIPAFLDQTEQGGCPQRPLHLGHERLTSRCRNREQVFGTGLARAQPHHAVDNQPIARLPLGPRDRATS